MEYTDIINEIQTCIQSLQKRLDDLRSMDLRTIDKLYVTRQEAADILGKSLRQMDRDCKMYGIRRKHVNNGIRICKGDLMRHLGLLCDYAAENETYNTFEQIRQKHMLQ